MISWSPQQEQAISMVSDWYRSGGKGFFYLAGFAGTGKTTIARHLIADLNAKPMYGAYTGKAAAVMRKSGCDGAETLHSKIYKFSQDEVTGDFIKRVNRGSKSAPMQADIFVIDECSMVNEELGKDIMSFGKPVLVLGDPGQLPPVKGGGFFTSGEPHMMLTEIHRQARDNPIIELASKARCGEQIDLGKYGENCAVVTKEEFRDGYKITDFDQVLVGKRSTRAAYNNRLRDIKGMAGLVAVGERLLCSNNNRTTAVFNGGMFEVVDTHGATDHHPRMLGVTVQSLDVPDREPLKTIVRQEFLTGEKAPHWTELRGTDQFEYGYVLTVHKAQGSQWGRVVLFDEAFGSTADRQRWRYTGITRAAEQLVIVR